MPTPTSWRERLKAWLPERFRSDLVVIPVVRLAGPIGLPASPVGGESLSIGSVAGALDRAFAMTKAPAVAIIVNSPGGSAVQSRLIFQRIRMLAEEKEKPVLVFVEDAAASGGYMIACAGDEIIADPSSIVGSIGVVGATFGFVGLMERLGVERRVYTAGEKKVTLDPFQPEREDEVAYFKTLQGDIHETFIDLVRDRRGLRLKPTEDLFNGRFWTGKRALDLGLVDRLGDLRGVLHERYGKSVRARLVNPDRGTWVKRLFGGRASAPTWATELVQAIEARAWWSRLGL
jgi:signal peptide peptidase SppA